MTHRIVGQPIGRLDGADKVTGAARFSADVTLPGMIWGKAVGRPRSARMSIGAGLGPWPDEAISITVNGGRPVRFVGGPIERHHDGCFEVDVLPAAPLARTPADLAAAFAGRSLQTTVARAQLVVEGCKESLAVIVRDDGRMTIGGELATADVDEKTYDVHLRTKTRVYDLDGLSAPLPGAGVASALVVAHRIGRQLTGRVYAIHDVTRATPIGRFTLR